MDDYNPDSSIAPKRTFFYDGKEISMPRKVRDLEKLAGCEIKRLSVDKMGDAKIWFSGEEEKASRISVTIDTSELDEFNSDLGTGANFEDKPEFMEKVKDAPITGLYFSSYYFIPDTVYENISLIPDYAIFDTDYSSSEITEHIADYYSSIVDSGDNPGLDSEAIEWFSEQYPEMDLSEYIVDDNLDRGFVDWDEKNNSLDFNSFDKGYTFSWSGGLSEDSRSVHIYYFSDSVLAYREFIDNKRPAYMNNACYYCSDIIPDIVDDTIDEYEYDEYEEEDKARKFSIALADLTTDGIGELIIYNGEATYAIELDKKTQALNVIAYDEGHCYVTEHCAWARNASDAELQSGPDGNRCEYRHYYYMFDEHGNRWQLADIAQRYNEFWINGEKKSAEEVQVFEKKLGYSDGYYVSNPTYDEIIEFLEEKDKFTRINIDYAHEDKRNGEVLVLEDFIGQ
ncbi:MAG: hypothetical protein HDR03_16395 [Lachnospiraceae bacterium]|nr:hypothetical protein [Lachnospiraceae bacterium]